MKTFIFLALISVIGNFSEQKASEQNAFNQSVTLQFANTAKDSASVLRGAALELEDHYGNPANFKRYIIKIPPVHA